MRTKFFLKDPHRLHLEFVQPKEAKPKNRIHMIFSMLLTPADLEDAPTQVRRVADMVSKQEFDVPKVPIATKIKGIDIEMYATPPTKTTPLQVAMSSCVLRDLVVARSGGKTAPKGELRLFFSVGISFDKRVWKWAGDAYTYDCFARFSQSQTELFDESHVDESIASVTTPANVEALAGDLSLKDNETVSVKVGPDPLNVRSKAKRGRNRTMKLIPPRKGRNSHASA